MTDPVFGMTLTREMTEVVPVSGDDFSRMILIEAASDASNTEFPVDTPTRFSSSEKDARAALGTGALADAVRGIQDQMDGLNLGADVTVYRVPEGAEPEDTVAAIAEAVGNLSYVPHSINATPRLVFAGRTAWRPDAETANPVIAALEANLPKILGFAPVDVDPTSAALAIDARETMASERLMPIGVAGRVYEGANIVTRSLVPRVLGLIARVDNQNRGRPFNPFANQPLYGLAGLSRRIPFSLTTGSVEGQQMLAANVAIAVPGEVGVDGAVADGGIIFIGTDNAATGELWEQAHQVRGSDYIAVKIMRITRQFLGKNKITADMAEAWINSIAFMLRDHKVDGDILGYTPKNQMFKASLNSPENIRLGRLRLKLGIEPAPVFKVADHTITRWRPAVEGLVSEIVSRLDAAA